MTLNKIKALYANEIIKIFHRPSIIIVTAVTLILSFLFPIIIYKLADLDYRFYDENENERARFEEELTQAKKDLVSAGFSEKTDTIDIETEKGTVSYKMTLYSGNDVPSLLSSKLCYEDLLANYDFSKYPTRKTWLSMESLICYRKTLNSLVSMQMLPLEERDEEWIKDYEKALLFRDQFRNALIGHDYGLLCKALESSAGNVDAVTPDVCKSLAETDPNGELGFQEALYLITYLNEKEEKQAMLDSGLEMSCTLPRILTEERKEILKNGIQILQYKFDKRKNFDETSFYAALASYYTGQVARYALLVLLLLIAGSSISQEMATGSIKSLIIAPVRRWKIFISKLLSIITCMLGISVMISLLSILGTGLFFGFDKLPPYLYVSGGQVAELPFPVAKVILDLVENITPFFYAICAFMISCFTKNTGVSVGVATGLYLFHDVPIILTDSEVPLRILDFTPVANLNLSTRLFPYTDLMFTSEDFSLLQTGGYDFKLPLWFSVAYIIILTFTVLFIAFEQFTKKDIQ